MPRPVRIVPIACEYEPGEVVYVYYLDAPEPALIDTGSTLSVSQEILPALRAAGVEPGDLRWILATHGHYDHIGGVHALWSASDGLAKVAIHPADEPMLADRATHLQTYMGARLRFLDDPADLAATEAMMFRTISGEMAADRQLIDGDRVQLGGDVTLEVIHTPGHSLGSVSFLLQGAEWLFSGDAVQACGSGEDAFPLYVDPFAYRASMRRLLEDVRPARMYLAHNFVDTDGTPFAEQLDGEQVSHALRVSLEMEARIAAAAERLAPDADQGGDPALLAGAVAALGHPSDDPSRWPSGVFGTLAGYAQERA